MIKMFARDSKLWKQTSKKKRKDQARTLRRDFLDKNFQNRYEVDSRRKQMKTTDVKGGSKVYIGDNPKYKTDRDEYGHYVFWY